MLFMADVIAIWETLVNILICFYRLVLLPFIFSFCWQMPLPIVSGRCYTTEADVIAYCILYHFMADVIASICGRCYYHFMSCRRMLYRADFIAQYVWQML